MPGAEQIADALHALVPQPLREAGRLADRLRHRPRGHRAGNVLGVADPFREDAAEPRVGEYRGLALDVPGVLDDGGGPGADGLQRRDLHHEIAFLPLEETGGRDREVRGVREAEVLVEAARDDRPHVGVSVDEAGEEGLAASVVLLGAGIVGEDRSGRPDRRNPVALDRESHVIPDGVGVRDGGVREDDRPGLLRGEPVA